MAFYVGMRVVCADDKHFVSKQMPKKGSIYTIREIIILSETRLVRLCEIVNQPKQYSCGFIELAYSETRFRPVVERPTSIEIFKRMLVRESEDA